MTENDTDILNLDLQIQKMFEVEHSRIKIHQKRLEELHKTLKDGSIPLNVQNKLQNTIAELQEHITNVESQKDKHFYLSETSEIIEKYKDILKVPLKISFVKTKDVHEDKNSGIKRTLVLKYNEIAEKYKNKIKTRDSECFPEFFKVEKSTTRDKKKDRGKINFNLICENCNKTDFIQDENYFICSSCGVQQETIQPATSYKDVDRINISTKYTYDRKVHFRDCILQYQGKQNCTIEQRVYDSLESEFEKHHLLLGKKGDKKEVRFKNITTDHVTMFLKELGFSKHYENSILIHYNMTGKKPDDISYLEEQLLNEFDLLLDCYDKKFKNKIDRMSFISIQFVLYQLLRKHKHSCRKEDFIILKTIDRKDFHNDICRELFTSLGWSYQET